MPSVKNATSAMGTSFVMLLAAGLGACGDSGNLGDQPVLNGQISGWSRGTGFTLQALGTTTSDPPAVNVIASAPIDEAGNFSITLPGSSALGPYLRQQHVDSSTDLPANCTANVQINPTDLSSVNLSLSATSGTTKLEVAQSSEFNLTAFSAVVYTYVDRDADQSGTGNCTAAPPNPAVRLQFDVQLRTGWNRVIAANTFDGTTLTTKSYVGPVPDGVKWFAK